MYRFFAALMLLIALVNSALTSFSGMIELDQQGMPGVNDTIGMTDELSHEADAAPSDDCHDHGQACRSCHLGHCQFTVSAPSGLVVLDSIRLLQSRISLRIPSVTLPGPAEPPSA